MRTRILNLYYQIIRRFFNFTHVISLTFFLNNSDGLFYFTSFSFKLFSGSLEEPIEHTRYYDLELKDSKFPFSIYYQTWLFSGHINLNRCPSFVGSWKLRRLFVRSSNGLAHSMLYGKNLIFRFSRM